MHIFFELNEKANELNEKANESIAKEKQIMYNKIVQIKYDDIIRKNCNKITKAEFTMDKELL